MDDLKRIQTLKPIKKTYKAPPFYDTMSDFYRPEKVERVKSAPIKRSLSRLSNASLSHPSVIGKSTSSIRLKSSVEKLERVELNGPDSDEDSDWDRWFGGHNTQNQSVASTRPSSARPKSALRAKKVIQTMLVQNVGGSRVASAAIAEVRSSPVPSLLSEMLEDDGKVKVLDMTPDRAEFGCEEDSPSKPIYGTYLKHSGWAKSCLSASRPGDILTELKERNKVYFFPPLPPKEVDIVTNVIVSSELEEQGSISGEKGYVTRFVPVPPSEEHRSSQRRMSIHSRPTSSISLPKESLHRLNSESGFDREKSRFHRGNVKRPVSGPPSRIPLPPISKIPRMKSAPPTRMRASMVRPASSSQGRITINSSFRKLVASQIGVSTLSESIDNLDLFVLAEQLCKTSELNVVEISKKLDEEVVRKSSKVGLDEFVNPEDEERALVEAISKMDKVLEQKLHTLEYFNQ